MKENITKKLLVAVLAIASMQNVSNAQSSIGLNFDGTDDRCTINDNAAYNLGTGNFTFEAWVKVYTPQPNTSPGIFYRKNGNGLSIFLNSAGQLGFNIAGAYAFFGMADIDDNVCHHIAVVRSSVSAVSVYVDGVLKGTTAGFSYGSISTNVGITIGYGAGFKGWIHEARFWNVARTQTQIQAAKNIFLNGNETGLIGYWRMNDGSGQTINDLSPTNNDGFLGTVNTTDVADPVFVSNSCLCPNPVITSTGGAVCNGQNPTLSTASIPGYTYQWRVNTINIAGATLNNYVATAAGNYQCGATAFGCSTFSNGINLISGAPVAAITAGGSTTFCTPNSVGLGANAGTLLTYQWKKNGTVISGATLSGYTAYLGGNYTCVVSNNCGNSTSNTITVTVNQTPVASITSGGPLVFCTGGNVTLTANSGTGYTYQWKKNGAVIPGATSQSYVANQSGSYTISVTATSGCSGTSFAVTVTAEQALSPTITSSYLWFCPSTTVGLDVQPYGNAFYQWFEDTHPLTGANNYELITGHNGNYKCTVTNSCGVYNSPLFVLNDFLLSIVPRGTVSATASLPLCNGEIATLSVNEYWMFSSFQWLKDGAIIAGANNNYYDATETGSYSCRMIDYDCNQTIFSNWFTLTFYAPPSAVITAGGPTTFCEGGSVTLNAPVASNRSYQWQKGGVNISGATSSSYVATTGGSYKVKVTNTVTGCFKITSTAKVVTRYSLPAATVTPQGPTTFCAGGSVILHANTGTGLSYKWKKNNNYIAGATSVNYTATTAGIYKVQVTNNNSCSKTSAVVTVTVPCKEGEIIPTIPKNSRTDFSISPNPASDKLVISFYSNENKISELKIMDALGQDVFLQNDEKTLNQVTFDISQLPAGMYFVKAGNEVKKFIKN